MSGIREAAGNVEPAALINLRRPLLVAVGLGVVGIVLGAVAGHVVMGILFGVGLGMGLFNARMMQRQVLKVISSENPTKRAITGSSIQRLGILTLIALALGYFLRPDGLGVFFGLVAFQMIFVANTMLPVLKERRNQ